MRKCSKTIKLLIFELFMFRERGGKKGVSVWIVTHTFPLWTLLWFFAHSHAATHRSPSSSPNTDLVEWKHAFMVRNITSGEVTETVVFLFWMSYILD